MVKVSEDSAAKFINALIKSVQTLCHGYLEFSNGIQIIGHINLSVDEGTSLDYILKEKVCKNAENSTLFISNSFHAEPKSEPEVSGKNPVNQRTPENQEESGRVGSAISSISSALTSSREKRKTGTKDSDNLHSHQNSGKRKASDDADHRPPKVTSHHDNSSASQSPYHSQSSPLETKEALRSKLRTASEMDMAESETLLPQTAGISGDSAADIGVNLAGSVLEPVDDQGGDLPGRDDDSDGDLEVTFIKEEFVEGERSACEYGNTGPFIGSHQRASEGMTDPSLYPVSLHSSSTYVPSAHDFQPGPSTSQSGSSSMRGPDLSLTDLQTFVDSVSSVSKGRMASSQDSNAELLGHHCSSRQNVAVFKEPRLKVDNSLKKTRHHQYHHSAYNNFSNSYGSIQRAFSLYRDDRRKKRVQRHEGEYRTKCNLALMNVGYKQLLENNSSLSADWYTKAMEREKRRLAKQQYRETLSQLKKDEIKQKDKERKRMKRSARAAAAESVSNIIQHFSLSDSTTQSQSPIKESVTDSLEPEFEVKLMSDKAPNLFPGLSLDVGSHSVLGLSSLSGRFQNKDMIKISDITEPTTEFVASSSASFSTGSNTSYCASSHTSESSAHCALQRFSGQNSRAVESLPWTKSVSFGDGPKEFIDFDANS